MAVINIFMGMLPFLCLAGLAWIKVLERPDGTDKFSALAEGALIWSSIVWLASYVPSIFCRLDTFTLATIWLVCLLWVCWRLYHLRARISPLSMPRGIDWLFVLVGICTLIAGLAYPPNIHDVLTYHMPRIMHWLQNHSVAPYFTTVDRQIGMAPFNAMIALQTVGLSKLDIFAHMGQWLAFAGCVWAAANLTSELGGDKKAALGAAVFTATLPCAIIQASNLDSCLLVSFYICAAVSFCLSWLKAGLTGWRKPCWIGLATGFAILSKGSAYPILFPLVCIIAWKCLASPRRLLLKGLLIAAIVITINVPHFLFTWQGTGHILGGSAANILSKPTPATFLTNILYNILVNFPFFLTGHGEALFSGFTSAMGIDTANIQIWPWGGLEAVKPYLTPVDGTTPNPLHLAVIFIAFIAVSFKKKVSPAIFKYILGVFSSTCMFALLLTWHPWITRIQIPLFLLATPICAIWLNQLKWRGWQKLIPAIFLGAALPVLFACVERPLVPAGWLAYYREGVQHFLSAPRERLLFNYAPDDYQSFKEAADLLAARGIREIALDMGANGIEYPIWSMLQNRLGFQPQIMIIDNRNPHYFNYIWSKPRYNISEPAPLKIIHNTDSGSYIIYPPSTGAVKFSHEQKNE